MNFLIKAFYFIKDLVVLIMFGVFVGLNFISTVLINTVFLIKDVVAAKLVYAAKIYENIENPKTWAFVSAIGIFISQYVFSQWHFAIGFFMIFILDTISGTYIAWRTGNFNSKIFRDKLSDKSLAYFTIITAFSVGTKIMLSGSQLNLIEYLNIPFYSLFISVELRSIVFNWYGFKKWKLLGKILDMLDKNEKEKIDDAA